MIEKVIIELIDSTFWIVVLLGLAYFVTKRD